MALSSRIYAPGTHGSSIVATGGRIPVPASSVRKGAVLPIEQTTDRATNQLQKNVSKALNGIKSLPFGDGNLIVGQTFTNGATAVVKHGLGVACAGFLIMNPRALTAGVPLATNTTAAANLVTTLSLLAAGTFTADVWCYRG